MNSRLYCYAEVTNVQGPDQLSVAGCQDHLRYDGA